MYDFVSGRLVERGAGEVVVEAGGIGYRFLVSGATAGRLPAEGKVTVWAEHMVRDDRHVLYGFASREERRMFLQLLSVNKVGPAIALALLSAMEPGDLAASIDAGDARRLSTVKGVGKRTAERLCLELKDRLTTLAAELPGRVTDRAASVAAALASLGYPRAAAQQAADVACAAAGAETPLADLVKRALQHFARSADA